MENVALSGTRYKFNLTAVLLRQNNHLLPKIFIFSFLGQNKKCFYKLFNMLLHVWKLFCTPNIDCVASFVLHDKSVLISAKIVSAYVHRLCKTLSTFL